MKFYITTPIYYINSEPHVGSAYTTIAADVLFRYHKLKGYDSFFLTGTDEHGQKIQEIAEKSGMKPKEFADKMSEKFKEAFKKLNISNTNFIRTTDKLHEKEVKELLQKLYDKKLIYKGMYESCYCVGCEQYKTKSELVNGKCPLHNKEVEVIKEEAYMFKLSAFQDKLLKLIEKDEYKILPITRKNEVISFIKEGLQDISISRKKSKVYWGIELPFDKEHTCYVWLDAFFSYVTGLKEKKVFDKFWPADVQLMAQDILRVHATIWPAMLLGAGYKLPKSLFIHGYFTVNSQKMSKSLGNAINPLYLAEKYGVDPLRYYLLRSIPFGQDGDFSEEALVNRNNSELADSLGNLLNRVVSMCEKYFDSKIPEAKEDKMLSSKMDFKKINSFIENYELHNALNEIFHFVDECNKYINEKEPWNLAKNNKNEELQSVLFNTVEALRIISQLTYSFMPESSLKIEEQLGFKHRDKFDLKWGNAKSKGIKKGENLFKKII
ncbi:MAG: methionine--tRNA ligase [Nanoarchaeota archaeon]|nr:methionine--tRNA ligase [Nanoarchaeota archaeon]MBU0962934.1 methionine--tRNA ligase [Nanoarchaeota archaeon]